LSRQLPVPLRSCENTGFRPVLGKTINRGTQWTRYVIATAKGFEQTSRRPIIFVAHSLGGIIVKSALIHSDAARQGALEEHRSIKLSTYGIVFMGTPHQGGSGVALGKLMVNIASVFVAADDRLLQHLEQDSEWLQQQLGQYGPISGDFVVPRASAVVPGASDAEPIIAIRLDWYRLLPTLIVIHADHIHMVKFRSKSDTGYKTVSGHVRLMAASAGNAVGPRWDTEGRVNAVRSNEPIQSFTIQFSVPEALEVEHFVGRDEELDRIHKKLENDGSRKTVVVHGLGGMGKTQLALAYAKRHRDEYSAVFWVNSKDVDTLKQGFVAAARRIFRDHSSLVHLKTVVEGGDLDKAMDALPGCNNGRAFDIRPFLPEAHQGAIIVTTRSSRLGFGHLIPLGKLQNTEHGLEILSHASGRDGLGSDPDARELARKLDGLPLALATAGAYLYQVSTSFAEYLRLYNESWLRLQQKSPQILSYEDRALYSTWELSLVHVKQQSPLAAKLLQLWAYFDNQDIWLELLQECRQGPEWLLELTQDQLSFDEAIRVLCDHALAEADVASGIDSMESRGYSMHSCVHSWTVHVLNDGWDHRMARLALNCIGSHVPDRERAKYWIIEQRLLRHAKRWLESIDHGFTNLDDVLMFNMVHNLGFLYADLGRLNEAEKMYQHHILTLDTVNNLGNLYVDLGRLDEAKKMYQRALQGYKKARGLDY
ncbi:tetratricopeptide repeat domain-containing protein, partial [Glonium stellatum]